MESSTKRGRLAFFTPKMSLEAGQSLGIQKKVQGQNRAFQKLGFDVELFDFAPYDYGSNILQNLFRSWAFNRKYYQECLERLLEYRPDVVYIRYNFSDSHFIYFLKSLKKSVGTAIPIFLEIATYPYDRELRSSGRLGLFVLYLADLLYRRNLRNYFDLVITYSEYQSIFSIPTIKIGNGVDVESIQPAAPCSIKDNQVEYHFIGVSNLVYWTGYERMIQGLADYQKDGNGKKVFFHVVGDGLYLEPLQRLANQKGVGEHVVFHGAHVGDSLDRLFQDKDLAIGNLGVHRKGMVTNPDLKNREYCARGIPFITSTSDPGFPEDFISVMSVPPDESAIQIRDLVDFVKNLRRKNPEYAIEMREFAKINFDWSVMLKPVADKMKACIEQRY